jgi:bacterioferritin-associated ferredoxin
MYLCNCNGLTVKDVIKACADGVKDASEVFACYNVEECCGKCMPEIQEYLLRAKKQ